MLDISLFSKKIIKGSVFVICLLFFFAIIINGAVALMEERESVIAIGKTVDGVTYWMRGVRAVLAVFIIIYWKELVNLYNGLLKVLKMKSLNRRQRFLLKKMHPHVAGALIFIELFSLVL